jgi:hypothetical protein
MVGKALQGLTFHFQAAANVGDAINVAQQFEHRRGRRHLQGNPRADDAIGASKK